MSFHGSLDRIAANLNETATLLKALAEVLEDHGGNTDSLDKLLADAKGDREIIKALAKILVGEPWRLVETPVDLRLSDHHFECAVSEFQSLYPRITLYDQYGRGTFNETRPRRSCRYRLYHFGQPVSVDQVNREFGMTSNFEHAGWREMVAYLDSLVSSKLKGHTILAAGSGTGEGFFSSADAEDGHFVVGWKGFKRPDEGRYPTADFFLVRDYSTTMF